MADFAAMIGQAALTSTQPQQLDIAGSLQRGATLAIQKEQLEMEKVKIQQAKQAAQGAAHEKLMNAIQKIPNFKGAARSNYVKNLKAYRDALGLTNDFNDNSLDFITASDENIARAQVIKARVLDPDDPLTLQDGVAILNDPTQFADVPPEYKEAMYEELYDAAKSNLNFQGQRENRMAAQIRHDETMTAAEQRAFGARTAEFRRSVTGQIKPIRENLTNLTMVKTVLEELNEKIENNIPLTPQDYNKLTRMGTPMARSVFMEKGTLSDGDVSRAMASAGLSGKIDEYLDFLFSTPNPKKVKEFLHLANVAERVHTQNHTNLINDLQDQIASTPEFQGREDQVARAVGITAPVRGAGGPGTDVPGEDPAAPQMRTHDEAGNPLPDLSNPSIVNAIRTFVEQAPQRGSDTLMEMRELARKYGISLDRLDQLINGGEGQ